MAWKCVEWSYSVQGISPTAKAILANLAHHADQVGRCWPAVDTICAETGLSRRTVQQNIRSMADSGLLTIQERTGRSSIYRLNVTSIDPEELAQAPGEEIDEPGNGLSQDAHGMHITTLFGDEGAHLKAQGAHLTQEKCRQMRPNSKEYPKKKEDISTEFEAFWNSYPRREEKAEARTQFIIARKAATFEQLMKALAAYKANTEPKFCLYAGRWLKKKRWLDEVAAVHPSGRLRGPNDAPEGFCP